MLFIGATEPHFPAADYEKSGGTWRMRCTKRPRAQKAGRNRSELEKQEMEVEICNNIVYYKQHVVFVLNQKEISGTRGKYYL
ncbi:hypothetical protein AMECASPLE_032849 [Ameca splendens]|uniref:Uncharacterized protein n=1 Tax=Ameca splendens TaxID=208324 RepID=A0ABV1AF72_9TELE